MGILSSLITTFAQAFYMATRLGGSLFGKTGAFERGYSFDALVVCGVQDDFMRLKPSQVVERFCYGGETKNIKARFLHGKSI